MSDISAVQGFIANLQSTMASLPSLMQQAAQSGGDFAAVLSEAQSALTGQPATGPAPATPAGTATAASPSSVVTTAEQYLGVPYLWGGTTPAGFDCSGFVQYVYSQLGVALPRTSELQATSGTAVPSLALAKPGDLVFYAGSDGTPSSPGHVGIYLGNGEMIDAPQTGMTVSIQPVGSPVAIRRVLPASTMPGTPVAGSGAPSPETVPAALAPLFVSASQRYGVPASLLTAVAQVESGFNTQAVSSAGAQGLMQIMPATAAGLGVNPFDPAQAIDGAAQMLAGYLASYGSTPMALAAYNAGPAAVALYGGVPPYPQTQAYVKDVMQIAGGAS